MPLFSRAAFRAEPIISGRRVTDIRRIKNWPKSNYKKSKYALNDVVSVFYKVPIKLAIKLLSILALNGGLTSLKYGTRLYF
jgi:hypothetical protein